ncbi:MAG TPA: type II secretion system F family protein [Trinickia sp.]|jgi:type IV pilus assembly protein PilC|nr:type II secretion system F family protein [Trinickia sp.]
MRPPTAHDAVAELRFGWRGVELDGTRRRGTLIALNAAAAREKLRREGIVALELVERGTAARPRATAREITAFTRQLASLLRAGLPLAQALDLILQTPGRGGMARIVGALGRAIASGASFAAALGQHPAQFDAIYRQLAAVGEASGSLAGALARITEDRERAAEKRAKARAALAYPCAVLLLAFAILAALLVWVVPTFKQVFDSFGAALPAPTRAIIALSDAALRLGAPALAAGAVLAIAIAEALRRSASARAAFDRVILALPLAGPILTALAAARWSRSLGTLLAAGTPLADALGSLTHVTGNVVFDHANLDVEARLRRGERLAAAMRAVGCFPISLVQPIAVAEESGALDAMLLDVAALAERQAEEKIAMLASLCEPLVVMVLGALVGGLVVALYLPIIELGNVV